jgi:TPR repeat protein
VYTFYRPGSIGKCPFCNSHRASKTDEELVEEVMKRVEANDAASIICMLAGYYCQGIAGFQKDHTKAMELYNRAADLGYKEAHNNLGVIYEGAGDMKKKFHCEAAAMAGNAGARNNLGDLVAESRILERAVKHWKMAASAGHYEAMHHLIVGFEKGAVSRELEVKQEMRVSKPC